jgi:hypothetical protein
MCPLGSGSQYPVYRSALHHTGCLLAPDTAGILFFSQTLAPLTLLFAELCHVVGLCLSLMSSPFEAFLTGRLFHHFEG